MSVPVLVGIGSNLDGPEAQIQRALENLEQIPDTRLTAHSSIYRSRPQGPQDQADYCNAAALLETRLSAVQLLQALQAIEQETGRVKTRHWGERIIDLDILFYGQEEIRLQTPALEIPHPRACSRDFVLVPVLEICPDWTLPGGESLSGYLDKLENHHLIRVPNA